MNKETQTKAAANFTIDKEILKEFKKQTKERAINRSALIQKMIEEWIKYGRSPKNII